MKILLLQEADWFYKGPHQQHHLLERLSIKGHKIRIIDYQYPYNKDGKIFSKRKIFTEKSRFYKDAKIDIYRPSFIKLPLIAYFSYVFTSWIEIKNSIKEFKPDVIIGYCSVLNNYIGSKIAKKFQIPYLYYWVDIIHELIPEKFLRVMGIIIEKRTIKHSTKILVINNILGKYIEDNFNMPKKKIIKIPGGVDTKKYSVSKNDKDVKKLADKLGVTNKDIIIFFMGWLYNFSGLSELIEEFSKISEENIKLIIVGEGEQYKHLKQIVEKNLLENKVILTGYQNYKKIPLFLGLADICILPAHNNKIMNSIVPIKIYEYMAANCPVITTKLPGIMEEFGGDNGLFYVDSPKEVLQKSLDLIKMGKIKIYGAKAGSYIKKNEWSQIIKNFEKLINNL